MFYRELEQLQNEKRKALLEHETQKLRECDDSLQREIREWKAQLLPRKQVNKEDLMGESQHLIAIKIMTQSLLFSVCCYPLEWFYR